MALGTIGKYERLDVLGHGASGIVYLARDTLLRRQVAIKEVSAQGEERERFLEEARVLDRLRHPNIVEVHNVDTIGGKIVIDMEYVDGENLLEIMRQTEGPLPIGDAVDIAAQVCDGLAYAQARHIVHRDIKPANILLTRAGQVKLVDFGLAQVLGTNSFVGGAGTYAYMAPEDFGEDEASDAQADIWAVGVILYEMLTGRRPFSVARPKDPFAWKRAIETETIAPPHAVRSEVPPRLSEVCLKALARDRSERYRTASELGTALRRFQGSEMRQHFAHSTAPEEEGLTPLPNLLGATDIDSFLSAAPERWEQARSALVTGHLARWLWAIGEAPLAEVAESIGELAASDDGDEDALLRDFLYRAGLDTSAVARRAAGAGTSMLRAGAYEDAVQMLMQAIRLDPSHPSYFLQLHKALTASGDPASAAATIARGLEFHPKDRALRREQTQITTARPQVSATTLDFGLLRHGEQGRARITVKNAAGSSGVLQGRIASVPGWIDAAPMTFITRRQQPITFIANTADLWEREQEYEGSIEIETSGGPLEIAACVRVRPPLRSFQEIFLWYMPLLILALAPLLGGEVATLRHLHHGIAVPYYAPGMIASGLLFAALWKVCADADSGPKERFFAALGTLLTPLGIWLFLQNRETLWGSLLAAVMPVGLLLVLQGVFMLRFPQSLGRWQFWGWIVGLTAMLVTMLFWQQTKI